MIDIGVLRGLLTLILFLAFLGLVIWLIVNGKHSTYQAAARLPLEDANDQLDGNGSMRQ